MSQNKLMTGLLVGAAVGVIISLFDRNTRNDVMQKSKRVSENAKYYASNKDELKSAVQQQATRFQNLYERVSEDASYVGEKVNELKELTPQVKEMVADTREAFIDTKDAVVDSTRDVKSALKEENPSATSTVAGNNSSSSDGNSNRDAEYGKKQ
ncbi:YtxH domain-containing protein [Planococcus sp. CAU13]|uniref:YtxH domain-containing protein n=1 Tax=Planococcus sp. CAU13 TaxID=1541197 RepID=UPI00052FE7D9|nr:YtxH domain-containing protein [Planococcus sp. CAU13]